MRLINRTAWRTDHLKAILQRCAELEFDDPARRQQLEITVSYTRNGGCSGHATLNGHRSTVRLPSPTATQRRLREVPDTADDPRPAISYRVYEDWRRTKVVATREPITLDLRETKMQFASVACHEFAHNRGLGHRQMPSIYKWRGNWKPYVAWAADLPLEVQPAPVVRRESVVDKLAHVVVMRQRAETRARRAKTILAKWRKRERYYQRQAATTTAVSP